MLVTLAARAGQLDRTGGGVRKDDPPSSQLLYLVLQELRSINIASGLGTALLTLILLILILLFVYLYFKIKEEKLKGKGASAHSATAAQYGTYNSGFLPDMGTSTSQDPGAMREGRSIFYQTDGLESLGIPDLVTREGRSRFYRQESIEALQPEHPGSHNLP